MSAEILFHPRIVIGRAAEIARRQGGELGQDEHGGCAVIVRCPDCRHAVRYDLHPTVGWCMCYERERSIYSARE